MLYKAGYWVVVVCVSTWECVEIYFNVYCKSNFCKALSWPTPQSRENTVQVKILVGIKLAVGSQIAIAEILVDLKVRYNTVDRDIFTGKIFRL